MKYILKFYLFILFSVCILYGDTSTNVVKNVYDEQFHNTIDQNKLISRGESALLLDKVLVATVPDFKIGTQLYDMPFKDLDVSSKFYESILRLSYFKGNDTLCVFDKSKMNFNPMAAMTRKEFVKIAMQGFDIPLDSSRSLSDFSDAPTDWSYKYFQKAVEQEIIVGQTINSIKYLYPDNQIQISEAISILSRIVDSMNGSYSHSPSGFEMESISKMAPVKLPKINDYLEDASVLTFNSMSIEDVYVDGILSKEKIKLTINATYDSRATNVSYAWESNFGWFESIDANSKSVYFYPTTTSFSTSDIKLIAKVSDGLGSAIEEEQTIPYVKLKNIFDFSKAERGSITPDTTTLSTSMDKNVVYSQDSANLTINGSMIRNGLEYGVEKIIVTLEKDGQIVDELYGGGDGQATLYFGNYAQYYGHQLDIHTQALFNGQEIRHDYKSLTYYPSYSLSVTVNADIEKYGSSVSINGELYTIDNQNKVYYRFQPSTSSATSTLNINYGTYSSSVTFSLAKTEHYENINIYEEVPICTSYQTLNYDENGSGYCSTNSYNVSYQSLDSTMGTVTSNQSGTSLPYGTTFTLTANPLIGFKFVKWSDNNTTNPREVTVTEAIDLKAEFMKMIPLFSRDDTNDIVTDNISGLMWQDNNDAKTITKNWAEAGAYCENLSMGGYDDWRLPSLDELQTIVDYSQFNPAINNSFLNAVPAGYWSSTPYAQFANNVWSLNMTNGAYSTSSSPNDKKYIRCARGGNFGSFDNLSDFKKAYINRDNDKNLVIDSKSGLIWHDDVTAKTVSTSWEGAKNYCENLSFGNYDDWRLPSIDEFKTIVDYGKYSWAFNASFHNVTNFYWSSTPYGGDSTKAYKITSNDGGVSYGFKSNSENVRCVRGGELNSNFVNLIYAHPSFSLIDGWNLIALPVDTTITKENIESIFGDDAVIWKYAQVSQNKWAVHIGSKLGITKTDSIDEITSIDAGNGFWIKSNGAKTVSISSAVAYTITNKAQFTDATAGWHLLGTATTKTAEELKTVKPNISIMWKYKDGAWQTSYDGTPPNEITKMNDVKAGEGFWVLIK